MTNEKVVPGPVLDDAAVESDGEAVDPEVTERPIVDVADLIDSIRNSLATAFEPVRRIPHYGESGKAVETVLREVLKNHLPSRFGFRSGVVVGTDGVASHQSDLLVVDEMNCPAFLKTGDTGIFPSGGILGSIEVTTKLDKPKFLEDAQKIRVLKNLNRPSERLHWSDAPVGALVAVEGPASIGTCAGWLASELEAAEERRWELPGCILVLGSAGKPTGVVCYWDVNVGSKRLSFNPTEAAGVCWFESERDALSIFLHCFMSELRRVAEERWKAVVTNFLLGPIGRPRSHEIEVGDNGFDASTELFPKIIEAVGFGVGHFPEMVSYFNENLFDRVAAILKEAEPAA